MLRALCMVAVHLNSQFSQFWSIPVLCFWTIRFIKRFVIPFNSDIGTDQIRIALGYCGRSCVCSSRIYPRRAVLVRNAFYTRHDNGPCGRSFGEYAKFPHLS